MAAKGISSRVKVSTRVGLGARVWSGSSRGVVLAQARRAETEELDPVQVDEIARGRFDRAGQRVDPAILDLGITTAPLAHDVVVMGRLAHDVGMLAVRQIEPFDETELLEELQRPKHGRPPHAQPSSLRLREQVERREVPVTLLHEIGDGASGRRDSVAGAIESGAQGIRGAHGKE